MLCVAARVAVRRQQKVLIRSRGNKILIRSYHMNCRITNMFAVMKGNKFGAKRCVNVLLRTNRRCFSSGSGCKIHPAIGIARLGNAEIGTVTEGTADTSFYDEPSTIGGLPTVPSSNGTSPATTYRDGSQPRKLLRQASVFKICDSNGDPITDLVSAGIEKITWSVWLANKKSAFYDFREFQGYPLLSPYWRNYESDTIVENPPDSNSYQHCKTPKRNSTWTVKEDGKDKSIPINQTAEMRQKLIIDFGPRTCCTSADGQDRIKHFDAATAASENPSYEKFVSYPSKYVDETRFAKDEPWSEDAGTDVSTLGYMEVDPTDGTLRVVAGPGSTCGKTDISSFAGGTLWWDDISDGPVRAVVQYSNGDKETLTAWCMVGSPKYAPELVNISTMYDVTYDAAVRYNSEFRSPFMVNDKGKFNLGDNGFKPVYERDIKPILDRMKNYQWVANVGAMVAFANPPFNVSTTDATIIESERSKRKQWFSLLREAFPLCDQQVIYPLAETGDGRQTLFSDSEPHKPDDTLHFPLMPLNSGDNSVMDNVSDTDGDKVVDHANQIISKFASVTPTQYYFLYQWANGYVGTSETDDESKLYNENFNNGKYKLNSLDRASGGNCVGYPTSPGIETTWNIRVPWVYQSDDPFRILYDPNIFEDLKCSGLDALRDECDVKIDKSDTSDEASNTTNAVNMKLVGTNSQTSGDFDKHSSLIVGTKDTNFGLVKISGAGLQPGDLTKRMAIPWQADFSNCSVQSINFRDVDTVRSLYKPAYYAYWWPPQAPWNVYLGYETEIEQVDPAWGRFDEEGSGQQVFYQRGIMEYDIDKYDGSVYGEMIKRWKDLGFIINTTNNDDMKNDYPYFVEMERNSDQFKLVEKGDDQHDNIGDDQDDNGGDGGNGGK